MNDNLLCPPAQRRFLRDIWQQQPLLAPAMLPRFAKVLDRRRMFDLACRDDMQSRLVVRVRGRWELTHGPFSKRTLDRLPDRNWTLLVNGIENRLPAARELQQIFNFIPYARHDDVMVSYAVPGGGVGPHFDSYDVMLLQGMGTRRWQISSQSDLALVPGAPLRILRRFRMQREWIVRAGDLLYLPPQYAHYGTALDECMTWSLGFRAPTRQEMAVRFLEFLQDRLQLDGTYRDPHLKPQRHPAAIGADMVRQLGTMLESIRWNNADITRCVGEYLSEPHAEVVFSPPKPLAPARFAALASARGLRLDLRSRMLYRGNLIFINGESVQTPAGTRGTLQALADARALPPRTRIAKTDY